MRSSGAVGESNTPGLYRLNLSGLATRILEGYTDATGISVDGRLWSATRCLGSATLTAGGRGTTQTCTQVLGGTATAATVRLTSDALTANATDTLNLTPGTGASAVSETCRGDLTARDQTTGATYSWAIVVGAKRPGVAVDHGPDLFERNRAWRRQRSFGGDARISSGHNECRHFGNCWISNHNRSRALLVCGGLRARSE